MAWGAVLGSTMGSLYGDGSNSGKWGAVGGLFDLYGASQANAAAQADARQAMQMQAAIANRNLALMEQSYADDNATRGRVLDRSNAMGAAMMQQVAQMGDGYRVDPAVIEAEAARRYPAYQKAAMDALDKAGSVGVADRMRAGVDVSTYDATQRAELAAAGSQALQQAYTNAYDDALKYVTGVQDSVYGGRKLALDEISTMYGDPAKYEASVYGGGKTAAYFGNIGSDAIGTIAKSNAATANGYGGALGTMFDQYQKEHLPKLVNMLKGTGG